MVETIFTKHPQKGRAGKEISKQKYDTVRVAIGEVLTIRSPLTMERLTAAVEERLGKTPFPGEVSWYVETVTMDLVARKLVQVEKDGTQDAYRLWPELPL